MKYNIAVIGTGYMARKHCSALIANDNARLVTVCSTTRSRPIAEEFKAQYGFINITIDFMSLLSDPLIDVLFICTPDDTHPEYVLTALQAGKHVLCEKPLARTGTDFYRIRKQLEASDKVLQVGMNCRFREQYAISKQMAAAGTLGTLRFLRGTYIYNAVRSVRNREKAWALQCPPDIFPFLHGGGIHCLDLLRWIGGDVNSVFARAAAFELAEEYKADTFSISLEFVNGAIGELLVSGSAFRPNDFKLELWFSGGSLVGTTIFRREGDSLLPEGEEIVVEQKVIDLALQYEDMVRAIESGSAPLNSFEEAFKNFRVLKAIEQSITSGQPVGVTEQE